jgi:acetyltransferase-like isoleucine patch superfamily enzyme
MRSDAQVRGRSERQEESDRASQGAERGDPATRGPRRRDGGWSGPSSLGACRLSTRIEGRLDPSVVVLAVPEIHGTGKVTMGRIPFIYLGLYLETRADGCIEIGDRVVMSRGVHVVAYARVEIGEGAMIGEYTSIRDANHRFGIGVADVRMSGHDAAPVWIGPQAWIGRGVTVLPGIRIGAHAVVGANSVVTEDVASGAVVGGVPARPLRSRRAA